MYTVASTQKAANKPKDDGECNSKIWVVSHARDNARQHPVNIHQDRHCSYQCCCIIYFPLFDIRLGFPESIEQLVHFSCWKTALVGAVDRSGDEVDMTKKLVITFALSTVLMLVTVDLTKEIKDI